MRIAVARYYETRQVKSEADAVRRQLLQMRFNWRMQTPQQWRESRLFNEGCDNVILAFYQLLDNMYKCYGGHHTVPGQKLFMAPHEFENLMLESGILNDMLTQRDLMVCYNLSMPTYVNEVEMERHL